MSSIPVLDAAEPRPLTIREIVKIIGGLVGCLSESSGPERVRQVVTWWAEYDGAWTRFDLPLAYPDDGKDRPLASLLQDRIPEAQRRDPPALENNFARQLNHMEMICVFAGVVAALAHFCDPNKIREAFRWWAYKNAAWALVDKGVLLGAEPPGSKAN